jgi:aspartate aminotransferase
MTGWRIGYLAAPREIAEAVSRLQSHSTSNPCSISQYAALAALRSERDSLEPMRAEFEKRRNYICARLDDIKAVSYVKPQGSFYVFVDISESGLDSVEFAQQLLEQEAVATVPGAAFGRDSHLRLSFACGINDLKKGVDRLKKFLSAKTPKVKR